MVTISVTSNVEDEGSVPSEMKIFLSLFHNAYRGTYIYMLCAIVAKD
jgi:hypothetical protein